MSTETRSLGRHSQTIPRVAGAASRGSGQPKRGCGLQNPILLATPLLFLACGGKSSEDSRDELSAGAGSGGERLQSSGAAGEASGTSEGGEGGEASLPSGGSGALGGAENLGGQGAMLAGSGGQDAGGSSGTPSSAGGGAGGSASGGGAGVASGGVVGGYLNGDPETGELAEGQCPMYEEGVCPEGCRATTGSYCGESEVPIDCFYEDWRHYPGCNEDWAPTIDPRMVNLRTGKVYTFNCYPPAVYYFLGWREATEEDVADCP